MVDGVEIITTGTLASGQTTIEVTASDGGSALSDFDSIFIHLAANTTLDTEKIQVRRVGQGGYDTAGYITSYLQSALSGHAASDSGLKVGHRQVGNNITIENFGLEAPTMATGLDFTGAFPASCAAIHPYAEACDRFKIVIGSVLGADMDYEIYGSLIGTKAAIIKVVDYATDYAANILVEEDLNGNALSQYEHIRCVSHGFTGVGAGASIYLQVREEGGSILTSGYEMDYFQSSAEGQSSRIGFEGCTDDDHTVTWLRGFGLNKFTIGRASRIGPTASMQANLTDLVGSETVHDAINIHATASVSVGKLYLTGVRK